MFNTICGSWSSVQDWSTLLVQLIVRGVVDLTNNSDLFTLLLDMLAILIHSALIQDREGNLSCLLPVKVTEWTHFELWWKLCYKNKRGGRACCVVLGSCRGNRRVTMVPSTSLPNSIESPENFYRGFYFGISRGLRNPLKPFKRCQSSIERMHSSWSNG